jgi:hypothetical protein
MYRASPHEGDPQRRRHGPDRQPEVAVPATAIPADTSSLHGGAARDRGGRLVKSAESSQIDAPIALAMVAEGPRSRSAR